MVEMTGDFWYDILQLLYDKSPATIDIAAFIHKRREITGKNRQYYRHILDLITEHDKFIITLPDESSKLSRSKGVVFDDTQIMATILPAGIDEFGRLKKSKFDTLNAERAYKTYKLTKSVAWLGLISGGILLILRILEALGIHIVPK